MIFFLKTIRCLCQKNWYWNKHQHVSVTLHISHRLALTLALSDSRDSSMCSNSELLISSSMPVILLASSECICWISGKRRSPSICFCSWGRAAANMLEVRGAWPGMTTAWAATYNDREQYETTTARAATYKNNKQWTIGELITINALLQPSAFKKLVCK